MTTRRSPDYVSTPWGGDAMVEASGPVFHWYEDVCTTCGCPKGPRNARPLVFAQQRMPRARVAMVVFGRRKVTLVRRALLTRMCGAIPAIARVFRDTSHAGWLELVERDAIRPVARPNTPWDRLVQRCPACRGLLEDRLAGDPSVGVCLGRARPPFFVYAMANRLRLFVRADLFDAAVGGPRRATLHAHDVPRRDAASLASVARPLKIRWIAMPAALAREKTPSWNVTTKRVSTRVAKPRPS